MCWCLVNTCMKYLLLNSGFLEVKDRHISTAAGAACRLPVSGAEYTRSSSECDVQAQQTRSEKKNKAERTKNNNKKYFWYHTGTSVPRIYDMTFTCFLPFLRPRHNPTQRCTLLTSPCLTRVGLYFADGLGCHCCCCCCRCIASACCFAASAAAAVLNEAGIIHTITTPKQNCLWECFFFASADLRVSFLKHIVWYFFPMRTNTGPIGVPWERIWLECGCLRCPRKNQEYKRLLHFVESREGKSS